MKRALTFTRGDLAMLVEHPTIATNQPLVDLIKAMLSENPDQQTFDFTLTGPLDKLPPKPPSS